MIIFQSGYSLPRGDYPLTHARISHSGNWKSGGTSLASTTATGYFADAPLGSLTYENWKPTAVPATWEYNHGSAFSCDNCCIASHTLSGCTINFQYWNGSSWISVTTAIVVSSNAPIMAFWPPVFAQRWRVNITAGSPPEIAVIKFGKLMQIPRPIYGGHSPIDFGRQTILRSNHSETGQYLGRTRQRVMLGAEYNWQNLEADWIRANWKNFQLAIETEPFFIAWRPGSFDEVAYCQTDAIPVPQNMGIRDLMSVSLSVRGLAYD